MPMRKSPITLTGSSGSGSAGLSTSDADSASLAGMGATPSSDGAVTSSSAATSSSIGAGAISALTPKSKSTRPKLMASATGWVLVSGSTGFGAGTERAG